MLRGFYAIVDLTQADLDADLDAPPGVREQRAIGLAAPLLTAAPCMLQLRAKHASAARLLELAVALRALCRAHRVPFCVNDRLDVALAAEADAVHLGQDDLPLPAALRVLATRGSNMKVGVSTHDEAQARQAVAEGAHYIGFGPVFPTRTKENPDPVVGLERLAEVAANSPVPVVAIGGISLQDVTRVANTGVAAAAVVSAVLKAESPEEAARAVQRAFAIAARP